MIRPSDVLVCLTDRRPLRQIGGCRIDAVVPPINWHCTCGKSGRPRSYALHRWLVGLRAYARQVVASLRALVSS